MKGNSICLIIHPFVYINKIHDQALIYNTENGEKIIVDKNAQILKLVYDLIQNDYVLRIDEYEAAIQPVRDFISELQNKQIGLMIDSSDIKSNPFQLSPRIAVRSAINNETDIEIDTSHSLTFLRELTLYLSSTLDSDNKILQEAYKQHRFVANIPQQDHVLPFRNILNLLDSLAYSGLKEINIIGGNILYYSKISELAQYLDTMNIQKNYYLYFRELSDFDFLKDFLLNRDKTNLIIQFNGYLDKSFLLNLTTHLSQYKERISFDIAISSEQELHNNESILSNIKGFNYYYKPYYTGSNADFFKKHVFIEEEDILSEVITQNEIIKSTSINRFYWGGLTILSDGTVFSNMNDVLLGNILNNSIKELIHNELKRDSSWRLVRKSVSPCKNCIYCAFCPPISNYDFILNKFNLCNVN